MEKKTGVPFPEKIILFLNKKVKVFAQKNGGYKK
jgi:hypothetical protein